MLALSSEPARLRFADYPLLGDFAEMPRRYLTIQRWISAQGLPRVGRGRALLSARAEAEQLCLASGASEGSLRCRAQLRADLRSFFAPTLAPPDRRAPESASWRRDLALQTNVLAVRQRQERRIQRCALQQGRSLAHREWICWTLRRLDAAGELAEELLAISERTYDQGSRLIGSSNLETFRGLVEREAGLGEGVGYLDYLDGADLSLRGYFD